jgi:hydrogenase expression/formation protein HypE
MQTEPEDTFPANFLPSCPTTLPPDGLVLLAHGEGARLTRRLVREEFVKALDNPFLSPLNDAAVLPASNQRLVVTTDSYVITPLFFPGGDIGSLAVHGTVNDLAVSGAEPLYLTLALIIEEGLPLAILRKVVASIQAASRQCNVQVVAGDTKVVPRGAADGLFVNTTGLGRLPDERDLGCHRIQCGDRVLVSGTIGDHGMAILSTRENLEFESVLASDTASIHHLVQALFEAGIDVHFLRDPTRGGVSATLHEVVEGMGHGIVIEEASLPVSDPVRGACEILGLDPLYVANEGKLIALVAAADADKALSCLRRHKCGERAAMIGEVIAASPPHVLVRGPLGRLRILDEPSGAPLPRIC